MSTPERGMNERHRTAADGSEDPTAAPPGPEKFDLHSFFPYLVRIYYRAVSDSVADICMSRYGLSVMEWRTMSVLGPRVMSAGEIVEQSSMNKVNVTRAVQGLRKAGFLRRDIDGEDRRRSVLRLTDKGASAYRALVPLVTQLEHNLLAGLSADERNTLIRLMEKVRTNADALRTADPSTQS